MENISIFHFQKMQSIFIDLKNQVYAIQTKCFGGYCYKGIDKNINRQQLLQQKQLVGCSEMRPRKSTQHKQAQQHSFLEDLQDSLLSNGNDPFGIDAFENIYNKKKVINQRIEKEKKKKEEVSDAMRRAKQRIAQIEQLNDKVQKQASLLKSQVAKINEVHMVSKILMMEKILRLQRETDDLEKKRNLNQQIRMQKHRASLSHRVSILTKIQKTRARSLSKTIELQHEKQIQEYTNWKKNRQKNEQIKNEKERRRRKAERIEEYKRMIAQKNYHEKIEQMQNTLDKRENELNNLMKEQSEEEKHFRATDNVTKQVLGTFFPTETI